MLGGLEGGDEVGGHAVGLDVTDFDANVAAVAFAVALASAVTVVDTVVVICAPLPM